MANVKYDEAAFAQKFNLTEAESLWVTAAVGRGADAVQSALSIRAQRVGPAADASWRPLPADVAAEVGDVEEPAAVEGDADVEELD